MQYDASVELDEKQDSVKLVKKELETLPCKIFQENHRYIMQVINRSRQFPNARRFFSASTLVLLEFF